MRGHWRISSGAMDSEESDCDPGQESDHSSAASGDEVISPGKRRSALLVPRSRRAPLHLLDFDLSSSIYAVCIIDANFKASACCVQC